MRVLTNLLMTLLLCGGLTAHAKDVNKREKIALVLGNGSYSYGQLRNPINDVRAMHQMLRALGFEVIVRENAGMQAMLDATREFALKAREANVRLFFYAGHGVQVKGRNYLIPVDSQIETEEDIQTKSLDMSELLGRLGQIKAGLNIVILDACRNNPFANLAMVAPDGRRIKLRGTGRPGLAQVEAPLGTLVAFSTAPGSVAMDGSNSPNSLYTKHLLSHMTTPGLPVEQVFKRVRVAVAQETNRMQIPWESSSLMGDFCFKTSSSGSCE